MFIEMNSEIAIAWSDLTFEVRSLWSRKKTTILSSLNGLAEFGTINAVMGPSGAGLTSLMRCLNGMNNRCLTPTTKIWLNSNQKIRSTYVANNEKDFLIMGLTAKQNLIYASKLKNSCEDVNHELNASQIMSDLLISDTSDTKAENCSGGQQKRLAIGLELTALHKPNLIFFDEPTTGLDSNVAEVVSNEVDSIMITLVLFISGDHLFETIIFETKHMSNTDYTSAEFRHLRDVRQSLRFGQRRTLCILRTTEAIDTTSQR